jgi:lipoprotein signal peptidase
MEAITRYFTAEKSESILFMLTGVLAIILAVFFLIKVKQPFYNGMAYAFILIALIQIAVGGSIFMRSPKDIIRVTNILQNDKTLIQTEEIPRMKVVMKNFILYRWIEIALVLAGIFLFLRSSPETVLKGIGLGLIIQAGIMLMLDYFAEDRGKKYIEFLSTLL